MAEDEMNRFFYHGRPERVAWRRRNPLVIDEKRLMSVMSLR